MKNKSPFIMLAPMDGVVDFVTRSIYSEIGGFDRFVTEFVRVSDRVQPDHVFQKYCPELFTGGKTTEGIPVFVQLLGGNPELLAENASFVVGLGALGVDINFGCPAPTVNRHDGGATLLKKPSRVFDVLKSVRAALPKEIPVTAKVRLGFEHKDFVLDIAKAAEAGGASMLTVHARTKMEGYRPPAHWEFIAMMKQAITIPVVANGEIWSVQDYLKCREVSGCEDVALGRGAIAAPDLAWQIRAHLNEQEHSRFAWQHIQDSLLPKFIENTRSHRSTSYAVGRTKQWIKHLARSYPEASEAFERIKRTECTSEMQNYLSAR